MNKLYLLLLILFSQTIVAQNFKANLGVGFPDLPHLGFAFELDHTYELGIQFGYIPAASSSEGAFTGTVDIKIGLAQSKKYDSLSSWFFGLRPSYMFEENEDFKYQLTSWNFSIGRHIYFSEKYGMSIDAGVLLWLGREREVKELSNPPTGYIDDRGDEPYPRADDPDILPNFRIQFFRRF